MGIVSPISIKRRTVGAMRKKKKRKKRERIAARFAIETRDTPPKKVTRNT
jgi:hypothetical protein